MTYPWNGEGVGWAWTPVGHRHVGEVVGGREPYECRWSTRGRVLDRDTDLDGGECEALAECDGTLPDRTAGWRLDIPPVCKLYIDGVLPRKTGTFGA